MTRTIFLLSEDGDMKEMALTTYPSEDLLQRLLAEHPSVLSSVHTDPGRPGVASRRMGGGRSEEEGGASRWSLDHLFLDRELLAARYYDQEPFAHGLRRQRVP